MSDLMKAQILFKLIRKNNWGHKYDRLEHFKRFQDLDRMIKELSKTGWILIYKKPKFTGISLDTKYKNQIVEFIEKHMPYLKEGDWIV
jgi:hypothetical protein